MQYDEQMQKWDNRKDRTKANVQMRCLVFTGTKENILMFAFCSRQAHLDNTKAELQQKITTRQTKVDEIDAALKSCEVRRG